MATSRDTPNPLRPYYVPPSIGLPNDNNATAGGPAARSFPSRGSAPSTASGMKPTLGSQARDYLSDLEYGEYLSDGSPGVAEMTKRLVDQALWSYTCVLLAQPFEVAKTVLQCRLAVEPGPEGEKAGRGKAVSSRGGAASWITDGSRPSSGKFEDYPSDGDSETDSASYFTSTAPHSRQYMASPSPSPTRGRRRQGPSRSDSSTPTPSARSLHQIQLRRPDSLLEVIGQLWARESAWGVWKGTNATFVYNFLLKTIESWTRSLLSALLNVPDPSLLGSSGTGFGGLDIVDSPSPLASLAVAVAAAGVAGAVMAPLDMVRTRLIISPITSTPRAILPSLRSLPSFHLSSALLPITFLHSTLPTLFSTSTPLFLRSRLGVDPVLTPATYSVSTFLSSVGELFLRLPLETVLRRGQVATLQEHDRARDREAHSAFRAAPRHRRDGADSGSDRLRTVVDVGPYKGVLGTMWFVVREEGTSAVAGRVRKGQGVQGLWRGWRVGFWGIVGVWGAAALGGGAGGEF